jgi:hypothetical protein
MKNERVFKSRGNDREMTQPPAPEAPHLDDDFLVKMPAIENKMRVGRAPDYKSAKQKNVVA